MIIALIGPDGSGKTTYSQKLKKYLREKGYKVKIHYPFNYFLLRKILDIFKKTNNKKTTNKTNKNLIFKFWPIIALIDNYLDYLINLVFYDGIVICERYYYDLATSYKEFGYTFDWLYDIYLKLIPKADKCLVFNARPDILIKRETGFKHEKEFFINQTKRYRELSKRFNFQTINVENNKQFCFSEIINNLNIEQLFLKNTINFLIFITIFILLIFLFFSDDFSKKNTFVLAYAILAIIYQKFDVKLNILISIILLAITSFFAHKQMWELANLFGIYTYYFFTITILSELAQYLIKIFNDKKI